MTSPSSYSRVIIHQFDPELPVPGGVDTCIRDILSHTPEGEKVLVIGVSQTRPLHRKVTLNTFSTPIDFIPISRANPGDQARIIPHSVRVAVGAFFALLRVPVRESVLQVHRVEAGVMTRLFRSRRRVYFVHTNTAASLQSHSDSFWRRAPGVFLWLERIVLRSSQLTVVFNKESAESYAQKGYAVKRMRTWFDEKLYFPSPVPHADDVAPTVIWVGRLEAPKDPVLGVDVFAELLRVSDAPWRCVIVGDGTLREEVTTRIAAHGIADSVELTGAVSRSDVAAYMRDADAMLMTSRFEGSPRVMYEAMGSALPVVASAGADPDGAIQPSVNGIRVEDRVAQSFAVALEKARGLSRDAVYATARDQAATVMVAELWRDTNGPVDA